MTKLQKVQQEVKRLWNLMCAEEGVPTDAKFVVFNSTNSHSVAYTNAVKEFFRLKKYANRNVLRRARHAVMTDLGLKRVKGALGGTYYE